MTPDDDRPVASDPVEHDPEVAEEYADAVGVDPTQEQINTYLGLVGEEPPGTPAADVAPGGAGTA